MKCRILNIGRMSFLTSPSAWGVTNSDYNEAFVFDRAEASELVQKHPQLAIVEDNDPQVCFRVTHLLALGLALTRISKEATKRELPWVCLESPRGNGMRILQTSTPEAYGDDSWVTAAGALLNGYFLVAPGCEGEAIKEWW